MFPVQTEPDVASYRLQLPPGGCWTDWRPIEQAPQEPHVLSVQVSNAVTPEQLVEFGKHFTVG